MIAGISYCICFYPWFPDCRFILVPNTSNFSLEHILSIISSYSKIGLNCMLFLKALAKWNFILCLALSANFSSITGCCHTDSKNLDNKMTVNVYKPFHTDCNDLYTYELIEVREVLDIKGETLSLSNIWECVISIWEHGPSHYEELLCGNDACRWELRGHGKRRV